MRAACSYAARALAMGEPWAQYDPWTCQVKFMYMETGYNESFKKAWLTTQLFARGAGDTW